MYSHDNIKVVNNSSSNFYQKIQQRKGEEGMLTDTPKEKSWGFEVFVLALVIVLSVASIFSGHKRNEAEAEVQKLKTQLQKTESQLNRMDTEFFHDGEATFFLVKKSRINNQNAQLLGIKFVNPMNNAQTDLVPGIEVNNYYVFKALKPIPWKAFQVKVVTTGREELLKIFP